MDASVLFTPGDRDVLTGLAGISTAQSWLDVAGAAGFVQAMLVSLPRFQAVNQAFGK